MATESKQNNMTITISNGNTIEKKKIVRRNKFTDKIIPGMCISECEICGELDLLSSKITPKINCPYCPFGCCKKCFDYYILNTPGDTKCMSCKREYDLDTIWKLCNNSVYKSYTDYKFEQLVQKEKSLFQASLIEIEIEKKREKAKQYLSLSHQVGKVQSALFGFQLEIWNLAGKNKKVAEKMMTSLGLCLEQFNDLKVREKTDYIRTGLEFSYNKAMRELSSEEKTEEMKQNTFIKHCSVPDCKGTLNNRWNCRLCEKPHCNKCGELKSTRTGDGERKADDIEEHTCDPNSVQNMEEIKRNSKPCPKCSVPIFKTEGCDQMFCIVCHTAFSWKTLQIETGRIHNPHYYEILRKNGDIRREEGDIRPCDELVQWTPHIEYVENHLENQQDKLMYRDTIRFINELDTVWNETRCAITNDTFGDIRKKYIKNETTEKEYRRQMKMKYNKMTKKFEVCQVLNITKIAMSEELKKVTRNEDGSFITRAVPRDEIQMKLVIYKENIENIVGNTNRILKDIGKKYTSYNQLVFDNNRWNIFLLSK